MRTTILRLAESVSVRPLNPRDVSAALLPPIPLYRRLLRAHRDLPLEMRSLGDDYIKSEFRRHRTTDNPVYIMGFLSQWKMYLDELRQQQGNVIGKKLDPTVFEKMSDEQIGQLYEVMHSARDIWKPATEGSSDAAPAGSLTNDDAEKGRT